MKRRRRRRRRRPGGRREVRVAQFPAYLGARRSPSTKGNAAEGGEGRSRSPACLEVDAVLFSRCLCRGRKEHEESSLSIKKHKFILKRKRIIYSVFEEKEQREMEDMRCLCRLKPLCPICVPSGLARHTDEQTDITAYFVWVFNLMTSNL